MKVYLGVKVPTAVSRPPALHQRAERFDPDVGQLADRENAEPELGGGLQGAHHHPPPHVLWQRGINRSSSDACLQVFFNFAFQRFTQYLASSNSNFQLNGFLDKTGVQGLLMKMKFEKT